MNLVNKPAWVWDMWKEDVEEIMVLGESNTDYFTLEDGEHYIRQSSIIFPTKKEAIIALISHLRQEINARQYAIKKLDIELEKL